MSNKGLLVLLSGPSGAGKGTIAKLLLQRLDNIVLSISATTRPPRNNEKEGEHYFFKSKHEFEKMIEEDLLLEHVEYCGNYYGTPVSAVNKYINEGKTVILEIETVGALKVREKMPDAVLIFVAPPSSEELYRRLIEADTGVRNDIDKRLERSKRELEVSKEYDYIVVNDSLECAVSEIIDIIKRCRENIK